MKALSPDQPALAMIELSSIGRGLSVLDAVAKKAPVRILAADPLSSGKFMVLFAGAVAPVEESLAAGRAVGEEQVVNTLLIPNLHDQVLPALDGPLDVKNVGAIAIVETLSIAAALTCSDVALKAADVRLVQLRLARGIGGKGFFTVCGELPDVEAAIEAAVARAVSGGWLVDTQIVPRPHDDVVARFVGKGAST